MIKSYVCWLIYVFFFFKQKTAYEMRISDWSSDACSSDLATLMHVSSLYGSPQQEHFAQRLVDSTFADTVFFTNSGAEAVECALKTARRYHFVTGNPRSEERRVGKECASTGRTRWSPSHETKKSREIKTVKDTIYRS